MAGMMLVCHPEFSFNDAMGLEVLNPSVEVLVPMDSGKATLIDTGTDRLLEEAEVARDAVLLKLPHLGLDLTLQLIHRAKRDVKLGKLVVAAVVIGAPEVVPGIVMLHLY